MASKPAFNDRKTAPDKQPIPEIPGDGFPAEKDVSTPPPGTDQSEDRKDKKEK